MHLGEFGIIQNILLYLSWTYGAIFFGPALWGSSSEKLGKNPFAD